MIIIPEIKQINKVWIKIINPMERGWFINNIIKEIKVIKNEIEIFIISKNSLLKL